LTGVGDGARSRIELGRLLIRVALLTATAAAAGPAWLLPGAGRTTSAAPPKPRVVVTLTISAPETPVTAGDAVSLTARARPLPRGYRLLIDMRAQSAAGWTAARECARAVCGTSWTEPGAATVVFRARVVHRRLVTRGPITRVAATSRPVSVTWAAPPPPPPPPPPPAAAQAGRYCGFNDQGRTVCLDVTPDRGAVTNFSTQSIVTCGDSSQWAWLLSFRSRVAITNLTFTYAYSGPLTSSDPSLANIQATYSINGTLDTVGNAKGTLALTSISWDQNGKHYDCASAPYAWSARLGA
jgi:hypothetical protein